MFRGSLGDPLHPECNDHDRGAYNRSRSSIGEISIAFYKRTLAFLPSNNKLRKRELPFKKKKRRKRRSCGLARVRRFPASHDHCSATHSGEPLCPSRAGWGLLGIVHARICLCYEMQSNLGGCTLRRFVSRITSLWRARASRNGTCVFFSNSDSTLRENETRQLDALPASRNRVAKQRYHARHLASLASFRPRLFM